MKYNDYTTMNDGVKASEEHIMAMVINGSKNHNQKNCNSFRNAMDSKRVRSAIKNKPTTVQLKEVERLNEICRENGIKEIFITETLPRDVLRRLIRNKTWELRCNGINYENKEITKCKDCKNFKRNIGDSGVCKYSKRPCKATMHCLNAIPATL